MTVEHPEPAPKPAPPLAPDAILKRVKRAKWLRRAERFDEARLVVEELLARHPSNWAVVHEAANIDFNQEVWARALERFDTALALRPDKGGWLIHARIAQSAIRARRLDRAREAVRKGLEAFPRQDVLTALALRLECAFGDTGRALQIANSHVEAARVQGHAHHITMHRQFFERGCVREAYDFKTRCAQTYAQDPAPPHTPAEKLQGALGHAYLDDFEGALRVSEDYLGWGKATPYGRQLRWYCQIVLGRDPSAVAREMFEVNHAGKRRGSTSTPYWGGEQFRDYFQGRSVAVVGPADTGQPLGREIDGFDIVVRTNVFSMADIDHSANVLGNRVDVSYYVHRTFKYRQKEIYDLAASHGVIPVFRRASNLKVARASVGLDRARASSTTPMPFLSELGYMHAVQRIVWDLLQFQPSRIKLFNVTFYAGQMYAPGYRPLRKAVPLSSLGWAHDPLQGFLFIRNLLHRQVVEADPVAAAVLGWNRQDYVDYLQEHYGNQFRAQRAAERARKDTQEAFWLP